VLKVQANYILGNVRKDVLSIFYIAVSQPGFVKLSLGVPREMVEYTYKLRNFEILETNSKYIAKDRKNA
jgi:hypothetical protein